MIQTKCGCGAALRWPEQRIGETVQCIQCDGRLTLVCAEPLVDGAGACDFDAALIVRQGPERVGERFVLGGVPDIALGKREDNHVRLQHTGISRCHCRLRRIDFGPSRWQIVDNKSTNGLFVNDTRVDEHELQSGDTITIGGFDLEFISDFVPLAVEPPGPACPSCNKTLKHNAKICIDCGIYIETGRALVTSKGFDENHLAVNADTWIRICSWFVPIGLFPVASEAFGTRKPIVTWAITILTVLASFVFYFATRANPESKTLANLMLWSGDRQQSDQQITIIRQKLDEIERSAREQRERAIEQQDAARSHLLHFYRHPHPDGAVPPQVVQQAPDDQKLQEAEDKITGIIDRPVGEFHSYQLLTHALLHAGLLHLAGNLLFLLVFGLRVNELIGNVKMAIVYPLLAIAAGGVYAMMAQTGPLTPMLGASGAIMGLAGMYFVFFPIQRVHVAIWIRPVVFALLLGPLAILLIRLIFLFRRVMYKVFPMRGLWLLALWVGFNDVLPVALGHHDGTAHWAHLGGFVCGVALAILLLLTRLANGRGADLLSVMLGRHAWKLLGKPSKWSGLPDSPMAAAA